MSNKQAVITELYAQCKARGNLVFDNDEVREVCERLGFGNPFDVTKIDNSVLLPEALVEDDVFIVHLGSPGSGRRAQHQFVHGISVGYHQFEAIPPERRYQWFYRRSVLNSVNTSESNILSVAFNQHIIHDFLYEDIVASPKVYSSNRTQFPLNYRIGNDEIDARRIQVEIDFTTEYQGIVTVFEAKNGEPADFNVFQLFNPYRYYARLQESNDLPIESIQCCYLLRQENRLRLYLYTFTDRLDPGSIHLERNAEYNLVQR